MDEKIETQETVAPETEEVSKEELLEMKVAELEKQALEAKDQMLRHQADLENYRKRLVREKEEAVLFSNTKLIEELLQFMDNLERAVVAARSTSDVKSLCDGIDMIQNQLMGTLSKNWGLEKISQENCEFNPLEHEACMATVDENLKEETVLQVFQPGYKLHGRVIRPAKVKIGKPE